jgi:2-polyprenyl-3-methyl-5-hydroxy-6-metoxy-1,4-benzoquinol methylase
MICDFCQQTLGEPAYYPVNSLRFMAVFECNKCHLCQSKSLQQFDRDSRRTLSCDADWGNVRHGKGARFNGVMEWLKAVDFSSVKKVMDVGSNRGDFVLWVNDHYPQISITAIEPDTTILSNYQDKTNINIFSCRFEDVAVEKFDFIYSVHTLEHASSAREMLEKKRAMLNPSGKMLLEVPNLTAICDPDNVEEFFIDKHTFHFSRESLVQMVQSLGYRILAGENDNDIYNITLLLTPAEHPAEKMREVESYLTLINRYEATMRNNRQLLQRLVTDKLAPLATRQRVGYWGAGRIFNALVRYGGLGQAQVYCLVDRHLWRIIDNNEGIPIGKPESLKQSEPQVLVILGRSSADAMRREAHAMGIRHVISFADLMAQVALTARQ